MKKIFLLILFVNILVGCTPSYNLTFEDDKVIEKISLELPNTPDNNSLINNDFYPLHSNEDIIYNKNVKITDENIFLNLDYTYSSYDFNNSNILNLCFHYKDLDLNNKDYYYLKLNQFFPCVTANEFDINIITKNKVLMNNADSVKGNTYTWHVTEDNKDDLSIEIKIAKGQKAFDNSIIIYVLFGIIVVIIIFTIRWFINKRKVRNDF